YDYILIDCPPNLGAITMCGVYISQYYIIPVLPDTLSTYGLNQVVKKINDKAREIKRFDEEFDIKPLGVLINRYRSTKSYNIIKDSLILNSTKKEIPKVFNTIISNTTNYADVCDFEEARNTIRQKYIDFNILNDFVNEIKSRCDEYER
ncbi:ParA family protein, partial [Clostridium sp.]|uniref:ParA family protein n=1 Tax=Clostridium sp. TaxID=1506 RepID=UPI00261A3CE5